MHDYLRTVLVAPMTDRGQDGALSQLLFKESVADLLDQLRTLDKIRLVKRRNISSASSTET